MFGQGFWVARVFGGDRGWVPVVGAARALGGGEALICVGAYQGHGHDGVALYKGHGHDGVAPGMVITGIDIKTPAVHRGHTRH